MRTAILIPALFLSALSSSPCQTTAADQPSIRDIGIPVRSVNWVRLHGNKDGTACYATMGQTADNLFVLNIDPATGSLRQHVSRVKDANFPTATLMSRSGILYIGAAYAGHLLRFDPSRDTLDDLGAINPEKASFPCAIDEDSNGVLWIGSYGACDLTSYDPATGVFTRHGPMDEVDMYNYPMVNADGTVCCRIMMTKPHLVAFDPATGDRSVVGPVTDKGTDSFNLVRGSDGWVYIESSRGNFRVVGFDAEPVDSIPREKPAEKTAGYRCRFVDADQQLYRTLEATAPDGASRRFTLGYEAAGTDIFCLHHGPDGRLYGSSILPLHLFRYDPSGGNLDDLGKCSAAGEAYSMANLDGSMYISSYPGARVSVYDPSKPYRYGESANDNPRELGRIDDISYRPRSTLAGPLGRVWLASVPDYGLWGGPLSWYDPRTEEKKAYYDIAGAASCFTLAPLDNGVIAVGTTIDGGSGTQPKVDQAVLFLWHCNREEKIWEGAPDRKVHSFNALVTGPDGRLYGTVTGGDNPELFVFDPKTRAFVSHIPLPDGRHLDNGLQVGPDGFLYGFTSSCFYRLDPRSFDIGTIVTAPDTFHIAGPIIGKNVYFATGSTLRMIEVE